MFDFYGRAGRLAYFGFTLLAIFGFVAIMATLGAIEEGLGEIDNDVMLGAIVLTALACLWIGLAAAVRRCHDLGWSGWWILLRAIPVVNLIQALWLLFAPGEESDNEYGGAPA
jgi:uncharacterized membrane protein YhaH (DUF805 family)